MACQLRLQSVHVEGELVMLRLKSTSVCVPPTRHRRVNGPVTAHIDSTQECSQLALLVLQYLLANYKLSTIYKSQVMRCGGRTACQSEPWWRSAIEVVGITYWEVDPSTVLFSRHYTWDTLTLLLRTHHSDTDYALCVAVVVGKCRLEVMG